MEMHCLFCIGLVSCDLTNVTYSSSFSVDSLESTKELEFLHKQC